MILSFEDRSAALRRTRLPILWVALAYLVGVLTGALSVHAHNSFALNYRDGLVGRAYQSDPAALALSRGHWVRAAAADFAGNLLAGAAPSSIMGLSVALPFPLAVYRGWVGGIVSVDNHHTSRLAHARECAYYLGVLALQLIPYTLAGAAGVRLGLAVVLPRSRWAYSSQQLWLSLPAEGIRDALRIYLLVLPMFLIASAVEFGAR
jgi:Stage II sporulation protein M